ncbi:MAG: hypothetical protein ACOCQG_01710 [Candidatus Nanoarchaeia archaeon]
MLKKPFQKKSQGLSLNTVVIAALVVLVLVILAAILMGRFGIFTDNLESCPGTCANDIEGNSGNDCPDGYRQIPGECPSEGIRTVKCCASAGI